MKRKTLLFLSSSLVITSAFFVASCSSDDDFLMGNGLDINSQVPLTRSGIDFNNGKKDPSELSKVDSCSCGIIYFVNRKRRNCSSGWPEGESAQKEYDDKMEEAKSLGYQPGTPMSGSIFLQLGISSGAFDACLSETPDSIANFLNNKNNRNRREDVAVSYTKEMPNGQKEPHIALATSWSKKGDARDRTIDVLNDAGHRETIKMSEVDCIYYKTPNNKK